MAMVDSCALLTMEATINPIERKANTPSVTRASSEGQRYGSGIP